MFHVLYKFRPINGRGKYNKCLKCCSTREEAEEFSSMHALSWVEEGTAEAVHDPLDIIKE